MASRDAEQQGAGPWPTEMMPTTTVPVIDSPAPKAETLLDVCERMDAAKVLPLNARRVETPAPSPQSDEPIAFGTPKWTGNPRSPLDVCRLVTEELGKVLNADGSWNCPSAASKRLMYDAARAALEAVKP